MTGLTWHLELPRALLVKYRRDLKSLGRSRPEERRDAHLTPGQVSAEAAVTPIRACACLHRDKGAGQGGGGQGERGAGAEDDTAPARAPWGSHSSWVVTWRCCERHQGQDLARVTWSSRWLLPLKTGVKLNAIVKATVSGSGKSTQGKSKSRSIYSCQSAGMSGKSSRSLAFPGALPIPNSQQPLKTN